MRTFIRWSGVAAVIVAALTLQGASPTLINRTGKAVSPSGNGMYGGPYEIYWQAVPTSLTDVATADAHILSYCFYNSTGGALTLTIQTKDGSPLPLPLSGSLGAGITACLTLNGLLSKNGFSVQSSGGSMYYTVQFTN